MADDTKWKWEIDSDGCVWDKDRLICDVSTRDNISRLAIARVPELIDYLTRGPFRDGGRRRDRLLRSMGMATAEHKANIEDVAASIRSAVHEARDMGDQELLDDVLLFYSRILNRQRARKS